MKKDFLSCAVVVALSFAAVLVVVTAVQLAFGAVDVLGSVVMIDVRVVAGAALMAFVGAIAAHLAWDYYTFGG